MYVCIYVHCKYVHTYAVIEMYRLCNVYMEQCILSLLICIKCMHTYTWDQNSSNWEDFSDLVPGCLVKLHCHNLNAKSMYMCTGGAEDPIVPPSV